MENINNVIDNTVENIDTVETVEEGQAVAENAQSHYDNYKMLLDMIKEMNSQYNMYKSAAYEHIKTQYSLEPAILDVMVAYTQDEIENMSFETATSLKNKYSISDSTDTTEDADEDIQAMRDMFKDIKELSTSLLNAKKSADDIKNDAQEALDAYFKALESPEMIQKKREKLQKMKELVETEEDIRKKIEMKNKIKIMEESDNFSFLFKKFTDSSSPKFIKSIMEAFFIKERGKYIMDRFFRRIVKFGFDEKLYKYFFNLEEKFLPEEYHPFNNLFLFVYMKYVAYADPYSDADRVYVQALTSSIANLVYHRYATTEKENEFVDIIKKVDSYFIEYKDKFVEDNTTHPTHPLRLKMDEDYELKRKSFLIDKMKDLKIENIDESLSANELQEYMNSEIEKMIELNKEKESSDTEVVDATDEIPVTDISDETHDENDEKVVVVE